MSISFNSTKKNVAGSENWPLIMSRPGEGGTKKPKRQIKEIRFKMSILFNLIQKV